MGMTTPGRLLYTMDVRFTVIAPAGFRLLGAIEAAARALGKDLEITSACDGVHSGENDPHHRGKAYDVRTHGLQDWEKDKLLALILNGCRDDGEQLAWPAKDIARGLVTARFFGFVESPGTPNEHIHVQLRMGHDYPGGT